MQAAFTDERLSELRKLVQECLGYELDASEVYDCMTSILRMAAGKALKGQTPKEDK